MANYYVRSAAAGAADGSTWANAFTTLALAFTGAGAGAHTLWVADDHAENSGTSATTLTCPGTAASPYRILCVNTHATEPPTGLATSATVTTTTSASATITFAGFAYIYGIQFIQGSGGSSSTVLGFTSTSPIWFCFE